MVVDVMIAGHCVDRTDITVPSVIVVLAVVKERIGKRRNISANYRRFGNARAVRHAGSLNVNDISADQHAAHLMLFHHEVAVTECGCTAIAGADNLIGADRDDIITVQDFLERVAGELVIVLMQGHHIVYVYVVVRLVHQMIVSGSRRVG